MQKLDLKLEQYDIDCYRYRELKYFCRRYPAMKLALIDARELSGSGMSGMPHGTTPGNPTERQAIAAMQYSDAVDLIERCAADACSHVEGLPESEGKILTPYLLKAVTQGKTWESMQMPCSRRLFFLLRRRFFWLMNQRRR